MKTLAEALEVFTSEEVVSFKWDKQTNSDTGEGALARNASVSVIFLSTTSGPGEVVGFWCTL